MIKAGYNFRRLSFFLRAGYYIVENGFVVTRKELKCAIYLAL